MLMGQAGAVPMAPLGGRWCHAVSFPSTSFLSTPCARSSWCLPLTLGLGPWVRALTRGLCHLFWGNTFPA